MSFREKHLWVAIVSGLVVWGAYGWKLIERVVAGGLTDAGFARDMGGFFVLGLLAVVVLEAALTGLAMVFSRRPKTMAHDRHERAATLEASHLSLMVLIGLLSLVSALAFGLGYWGSGHVAGLARWMNPGNGLVLMANLVVGCIMVSELVRWGLSLRLLRRRR